MFLLHSWKNWCVFVLTVEKMSNWLQDVTGICKYWRWIEISSFRDNHHLMYWSHCFYWIKMLSNELRHSFFVLFCFDLRWVTCIPTAMQDYFKLIKTSSNYFCEAMNHFVYFSHRVEFQQKTQEVHVDVRLQLQHLKQKVKN